MCSCHFREGQKSNGPEIFERNAAKLFPSDKKTPKKRRKVAKENKSAEPTLQEIVNTHRAKQTDEKPLKEKIPTAQVILQAELDSVKNDLKQQERSTKYSKTHYSASNLNSEAIRMETGLPTREIFQIVFNYALRFKDSVTYYAGWRVESVTFEDQIFITLMKLRQNYTNLHLANLFSCSVGTISNIVTTFIHVLHAILFKDIMRDIPSRHKNSLCAPSSFAQYTSCRIVIDCTDLEIATPKLMSLQNATYSSYRGMNSFKVIVGVAPNAVITYISNLYPGSISDKEIVRKSGLLNQMVTGDLILADKGFLIQDIVPKGVSVNIPPFLENGKFTPSEIKATKNIAKCRIHVERANARLKDFKILSFVPPYLRCHADKVLQLCAALVNLQFPLITEGCEGFEFE